VVDQDEVAQALEGFAIFGWRDFQRSASAQRQS
jgi:hypothetical protein